MEMDKLRIEFTGLPPFKANPGPGRRGARLRQESFKEAAQRVLAAWRSEYSKDGVVPFPWDPMSAKIVLGITYTRVNGDNDAANIIGGISDALQGVFYVNDKQIGSISYWEGPDGGADGDDRLIVEVSPSDREGESK